MIDIELSDDQLTVTEQIHAVEYSFTIGPFRTEISPVDEANQHDLVDSSVIFETNYIQFPDTQTCHVYTGDDLVATATDSEAFDLEKDEYLIKVDASGGLKLHITVDSAVRFYSKEESSFLKFEGTTNVQFGVRSLHTAPAGTVTTPSNLEDAAEAVEYLSSGHKTDSPGRSFPTNRGHPPRIELGDTFSVDSQISKCLSDIEIEIPATWEALYTATPLVHYLSASLTVEPEATGFTLRADSAEDVSTESAFVTDPSESDLPSSLPPSKNQWASNILQHIFSLDCAMRAGGHLQEPTNATDTIVSRLEDAGFEPDIDELYDLPITDRVAQYLKYPPEVTDGITDWHYTALVPAEPEYLESLPVFGNRLAKIHAQPTTPRNDASHLDSVPTNYRNRDSTIIEWYGDDSPTGGFSGQLTSCRRRLDLAETASVGRPEDSDTTPVEITVVCNEEGMEYEMKDLYQQSEWLSVDITKQTHTSCDELRSIIEEGTDLLHFIGHITADGIHCQDGLLDVDTLEESNARVFFLNGCESFTQGEMMVDAGSHGGLVTTDSVRNSAAIQFGQSAAKLLNRGFCLGATLHVLHTRLSDLNTYTGIGDSRTTVAPPKNAPTIFNVHEITSSNEIVVSQEVYPTSSAYDVGTLIFNRLPTGYEAKTNIDVNQEVRCSPDAFFESLGDDQLVTYENTLFRTEGKDLVTANPNARFSASF